jgi:hypothetical protein
VFEHLDQFDHEYGSQERYEARKKVHMDAYGDKKRHYFWWLVHNAMSHPLIGFFPTRRMFDFHDWTSAKINAKD